MVFSSYLFLFYFLPLALAAYYAAPMRARHVVLTAASYFFYGWANPLFVILLFLSTVIDFFAGQVIERERTVHGAADGNGTWREHRYQDRCRKSKICGLHDG